jgi:UDP-N-acetyl-D-galactosamine dehydrogenase
MSNENEKKTIVAVVGLGYVGLPLAVLLATKHQVIGFDINQSRVAELQSGYDRTAEVADIGACGVDFTSDIEKIGRASVVIVAVPTPIDHAKNPDLTPLIGASEIVGRQLQRGMTVVYESTVYPGCTEEVCVPILERESGMVFNQDFYVGYSPERVNPGDREHTIDKVIKIVSASTKDSLKIVADLYGSVIPAGIHQASSIRVAEAAKVIENIKRDINIALVNELALIFDRLNIDTQEVLAAASTKWNFNSGTFTPGLVGGHCISVDPYYLTHKSLELGYHPQMILAGRAINEYMAHHVADMLIKQLSVQGKAMHDCRVLVMGLTFKEDVPDVRNSQAERIIERLQEFGVNCDGYDPLLDQATVKKYFKIENIDFEHSTVQYDAILVFSPHKQFKSITLNDLKNHGTVQPVLVDIKRLFDRRQAESSGFVYKAL